MFQKKYTVLRSDYHISNQGDARQQAVVTKVLLDNRLLLQNHGQYFYIV